MTGPYDLPVEVTVTADGPVRIVTMNRPDELNAVNGGLHHGMSRVWAQLAADGDARAAVLTGAGAAFSAGGDFGWFQVVQGDAAPRRAMLREARAIVTEMTRCPLPVVAAVNGPAVGFGCSVALLCDVVLIDENAFLADPHVSVGLVAGDGGAVVWPLLTSLLRAKEYLFTGERIPAGLAVELGLANRVVAAGSALPTAVELAHRLAAQPPLALQETKRAVNLHLERAVTGILDFALSAESESFGTAEHRDRVAAFFAPRT